MASNRRFRWTLSEEAGERYVLDGATVYFHVTMSPTGEKIIHVDVDHPELEGIVLAKESCFAGSKKGGVFIGLRPAQHKRAEDFLEGRL